MTKCKIYNSKIEVGARVLILLKAFNKPLDIQSIVYLDFLMLHYGDVDNKYDSLHPNNPYHSVEVLVKRNIIRDSLLLLCKKGLVDVIFSEKGIEYFAGLNSAKFLEYFESEYSNELHLFAEIVAKKFKELDEKQLAKYIENNLDKWKGEFEHETLFRGEYSE